jgi:hypothetical protein
MKSLIFIAISATALISHANSTGCGARQPAGLNFLSIQQTDKIDHSKDEARSGCCSHHSGACGCSSGSVQCCDDTASPTCGC